MISETYIRQLFLEYHFGNLSESEHEALQNLLKTDPHASTLWKQLEVEAEQANLKEFVTSINTESDFQTLKNLIERPHKSKIKWPLIGLASAVAAAILLIIGFSLNYDKNQIISDKITTPTTYEIKKIQENKVKEQMKQPLKKVTLRLADGSTLDLDPHDKQVYQKGGFILHAEQGQLIIKNEENNLKEALLIIVPERRDFRVTLPDQSIVWLNSLSTLQLAPTFGNGKREVTLTGEGYFDIQKNEHVPFLVTVNKHLIRVLGTQFNVNSYQNTNLRTSLVAGAVEMKYNNFAIQLSPGQAASYSEQRGYQKKSFDAEDDLSWMQGIYYFETQELAMLSDYIFRWYGLKVIFEDSDIAQLQVSGVMKRHELNHFLSDLQESVKITGKIENNKLIFSHFK